MQSPVRLVALLRPETSADLLAATAVSSLVFTSTPFLLPAIADAHGVSLGAASLISSCQLGGFVVSSGLGARLTHPSKNLLVWALAASVITQVLSAATPWFWLLMVLRVASGVALGLVAWVAWQQVFGDAERMGDLAVVGPVMGIPGAPLAAFLADRGGENAVFLTLGLLSIIPLALAVRRPEFDHPGTALRRRSQPIPITRVILAALGMLTAGGSAVFIFGAAMGTDRAGLDPLVVSLAFSGNALLGIPAARYRGRRPFAGVWLIVTAAMAVVMTTVTVGLFFWIALVVWGLAFWAGVPGVFTILAERSRHPADRAGDAQSVMAAGRVVGPLLGGALVETGSFTLLGIVAAALMSVAGLILLVVERRVPPRADAVVPSTASAPHVGLDPAADAV